MAEDFSISMPPPRRLQKKGETMTPQSILEDMSRIERRAGERFAEMFDVGMWKAARAHIEMAVHFEFASAIPKVEHVAFADEMMERGLFRMPFEAVLYTGDAIPKTGILVGEVVENGALEGLVYFVIAPGIDADGTQYSIPILVCHLDSRDHATGAPRPLSKGTVDWASITRSPHASRKSGRQFTQEDYGERSENALRMIMGGTSLMMSKDVETHTEPPPTKLNKRREEQGRPLIRERRVVVIKPERRASYTNAAAEFAGLRSSPKMHWRRGHFRRVREDLIVPVAPSIINAAPDAKPSTKQYRVEQGAS